MVILHLIQDLISDYKKEMPMGTMLEKGFVYMMANKRHNVLYIGTTNDLYRRTLEHKMGEIPGFTKKYKCHKLVYFEKFDFMIEAIFREKQLKNWKRKWKNDLIESMNPEWDDLSAEIGIPEEYVEHYE